MYWEKGLEGDESTVTHLLLLKKHFNHINFTYNIIYNIEKVKVKKKRNVINHSLQHTQSSSHNKIPRKLIQT